MRALEVRRLLMARFGRNGSSAFGTLTPRRGGLARNDAAFPKGTKAPWFPRSARLAAAVLGSRAEKKERHGPPRLPPRGVALRV